jgi:hypothetical protein
MTSTDRCTGSGPDHGTQNGAAHRGIGGRLFRCRTARLAQRKFPAFGIVHAKLIEGLATAGEGHDAWAGRQADTTVNQRQTR